MHSTKSSIIKPGIKIGVLGGGQLGMMLCQAAITYGLELSILDPDSKASCSNYTSKFVQGEFKDEDTVFQFGKDLDVLTIEIEHVHVGALKRLEKKGVLVFPQPKVIELIQDKGLQKEFFIQNQIPTAPFKFLDSKKDIPHQENAFPFVLKSRKGGYDGKGVSLIKNQDDLGKFLQGTFPEGPMILEEMAEFEKEISIIVARNSKGEIEIYDPVEMEFNPEANLVEFLKSPAQISHEVNLKGRALAEKIITHLNMVGILAIEMFLLKNGELWINEMAPRPHNSGHQTIEANYSSQFDQLIRAILNLPLGSSKARSSSMMINLLGELGYAGPAVYQGIEEVLSMEGVYLHLYGKSETRPMRKMGHITILGEDQEKSKEKAHRIRNFFKIIC